VIAPAPALPSNAPTLQGEAPPEVLEAIRQRQQAALKPASTTEPPVAPPIALPRRPHPVVLAAAAAVSFVVGLGVVLLALGGKSVDIAIESTPPGASVSLSGRFVGKTPLTVREPRRPEALHLSLHLEGYEDAVRDVTPSESRRVQVALDPAHPDTPGPQPSTDEPDDAPSIEPARAPDVEPARGASATAAPVAPSKVTPPAAPSAEAKPAIAPPAESPGKGPVQAPADSAPRNVAPPAPAPSRPAAVSRPAPRPTSVAPKRKRGSKGGGRPLEDEPESPLFAPAL
jgi:hypothetical protein